jgi:hypothetical protein
VVEMKLSLGISDEFLPWLMKARWGGERRGDPPRSNNVMVGYSVAANHYVIRHGRVAPTQIPRGGNKTMEQGNSNPPWGNKNYEAGELNPPVGELNYEAPYSNYEAGELNPHKGDKTTKLRIQTTEQGN